MSQFIGRCPSLALQPRVPVEGLRHAITPLDDGSAARPLAQVLDRIADPNESRQCS